MKERVANQEKKNTPFLEETKNHAYFFLFD